VAPASVPTKGSDANQIKLLVCHVCLDMLHPRILCRQQRVFHTNLSLGTLCCAIVQSFDPGVIHPSAPATSRRYAALVHLALVHLPSHLPQVYGACPLPTEGALQGLVQPLLPARAAGAVGAAGSPQHPRLATDMALPASVAPQYFTRRDHKNRR
jgi:hypothetical protein